MLFGIAVSIFILIVGLLLSQTTNAPSGSEYFLQELKMGKLSQEALKKTIKSTNDNFKIYKNII